MSRRVFSILRRSSNPTLARIQRRNALLALVAKSLPIIIPAVLALGYVWIFSLPSPSLGRTTYIDENALGPAQVNTHWNWADVHAADTYLQWLEQLRDTNATSLERASSLRDQFLQLGIPSATQSYQYTSILNTEQGVNTYAVLSSPRTPSTEAIVISASWKSLSKDYDINIRGVATLLALAAYLKKYSLWSKDLVFVVSDGTLTGMHAWLSAYHGEHQKNSVVEPLALTSGVIWTALNIDYPGHSFSHLGLFHEGINGRLCNQDLLNSFQRIAAGYAGIPVVLYDHIEEDNSPTLWPIPQTFVLQAKNILRHMSYQARGRPSGVHGLFQQYRINAFTLFAVPASGPHGFHSIGRAVESTLRTMNNLLERLHASFYFYVMTGPFTFIKIGNYLPSAALVSAAMMFAGLRQWVDARWTRSDTQKYQRRRRASLPALFVMLATHLVGVVLFWCIRTTWFHQHPQAASIVLFLLVTTLPALYFLHLRKTFDTLPMVLKAFNLCFASTVISVTTVLNFSLAASLAIILSLPLLISRPAQSTTKSLLVYGGYMLLSIGWIIFAPIQTKEAIWHWEILGVWFAPFVCVVYTPIMLQAAIVCILAPS